MKIKLPSDLLIILVWIILTILFIIVPVLKDSLVRTILGLPMFLFIPGYVLTSALFPKEDDLDVIERIALNFGLSIAIVSSIGLVLNYTPFGIRLIPIIASLTIFDILMISIAMFKRDMYKVKPFKIPIWIIYDVFNKFKTENKTDKIVFVFLTFSIILVGGIIIFIISAPKIGEKFTEFYILNSSTDKVDNYSTHLKLNTGTDYLLGIVNHEYSSVNYTLKAIIDNDTLISKKFKLENNQLWENNLTVIPNKIGNLKLEFWLFKDNNFTVPYRELHLWVNSS